MKITALETVQVEAFGNLLWVRVHTDDGVVGLGETYWDPYAVASHIHHTLAPRLLGQDPLRIDALHRAMLLQTLGYQGTGVEIRAASALDIALWDLFGRVTGQPVYQLLGGLSRDKVRSYNTCAGPLYIRQARSSLDVDNWGLGDGSGGGGQGAYEDLDAFLNRADELAESLLDEGITGMKIWPFDIPAEANQGRHISAAEMTRALEPFEKIRKAVGDKIDIMVELHSLWDLTTAKRIAEALEPYDPYWYEDPIKMNDLDALAEYARSTRVPVCASENLGTRWSFRDLLEKRAAGIVMLDLSWCGGLTEAKAIAGMAEAYQRPVAPHDCTGPVVFAASIHLSLNAPNALIQESVRAYYKGWYQDLVEPVPQVVEGYIHPPEGPGLGLDLRQAVFERPDVTVRRSEL